MSSKDFLHVLGRGVYMCVRGQRSGKGECAGLHNPVSCVVTHPKTVKQCIKFKRIFILSLYTDYVFG